MIDSSMLPVPVTISIADGALAPSQAYATDAGWDLYTNEDCIIEPGKELCIRTGVRMCVASGYYYRVVARSSTLRTFGVLILEGIIDAGYTGELIIRAMTPYPKRPQLHEIDPMRVVIGGPPQPKPQYPVLKRHSKIAQAIFHRVIVPTWTIVDEMPETARGQSGFGSSGK